MTRRSSKKLRRGPIGVRVDDVTTESRYPVSLRLELRARPVKTDFEPDMTVEWRATAVDAEGETLAEATSWSYLRAFEAACKKAGGDPSEFRLAEQARVNPSRYIFLRDDYEIVNE